MLRISNHIRGNAARRACFCLAAVVAVVAAGCGGKEAKDRQAPAADTAETAVTGAGAADTLAADTPDTSIAAAPDTAADTSLTSDNTDVPGGVKYEPSGRMRGIYESGWGYRGMERTEIPDTGKLVGLFSENGAYYLKPEKIKFKYDSGEDGCGAGPSLALLSEAEFLFLNFTGYNKNDVRAVRSIYSGEDGQKVEGKDIFPNEKFAFDFDGRQYEFAAFGEMEDSTDKYNVTNFSLAYSPKGAVDKQTIVRIPRIEHTNITLLFIGDLDGDGKPDLILDARSNYENRNILAFLSSTAKKGDFLRLEAHKPDWFDC